MANGEWRMEEGKKRYEKTKSPGSRDPSFHAVLSTFAIRHSPFAIRHAIQA
jgi:hypothetical protein